MNKLKLLSFGLFVGLAFLAICPMEAYALDTTRPIVSITSPYSNQAILVGNILGFSALASDNVGVAGVQFTVDGVNYGAEDTTAPYAIDWNSTGARIGSHYVRAIARDAANNKTYSTIVYFKVQGLPVDTTRPTVSITSPTANQIVTIGNTLNLAATASDNVGVAGVQFTVDGVNYGAEDTTAPYAIDWNSTGARIGSHNVRAIARDAANNKTYSTIVYFKVQGLPVDTTRPTVSITSPTANQIVTIGNTLNLAATASDNVGVAGVQFTVDGVNYGAEDTTAPYAIDWNSTGARIGSHYVRAIARDAANNKTYSTIVYFKVQGLLADKTPPEVNITSPVAGSQLSATVNISASAVDPVISGAATSGVKIVQFYIDAALAGSASAEPYLISFDTNALSNGSHSIYARAVDNAGNSANSQSVSITVTNEVNTDNLIPNPSLETADPVNALKPAQWNFESWSTKGITAVSTYPVAGFNQAKAAKTEITVYNGDGDAKWYFNPQSVKTGLKYQFSDYYQSTVPSRVVAWFPANGTIQDTYLELSPAAASPSTWTAYSDFVTVPDGATTMTVFHLIDQKGWLVTDDYSLTIVQPSANLIFNGDLETVSTSDPGLPAHWYKGGWGTNNRTFSYASGLGRSDSRGVEIRISSYTDGDARWYTDSITVTPGDFYKFFDWYKSDADTRVVAHFVYNDNTDHYVDLRGASASSDWTAYSDYVQIPANAKTMEIFHLLSGSGWLVTDDYSLQKTTVTGFSHPLVTLTFDDGWEDNVATVLPVLTSNGFKATNYFATQFVEGNEAAGIAPSPAGVAAIKAFFDAGNEIGSHSYSHPYLTTLSSADLNTELTRSKTYLESLVGTGNVKTFATPYGVYNQSVIDAIKANYQSHRTVDTGYNVPDGFDHYRVKVQNMLVGTTLAEYLGWVNEAKEHNFWLVLVYHRVADDSLGPYDTRKADFIQQMQIIKNSGIPVKPVTDALADIEQPVE